MLMRRLSSILLVILSVLLLSGCWDRWELNELSIITGMAIDKSDDNYELTMQSINPAEIASQEIGNGYAQSFNTTEIAPTIHESLRKHVNKSPRRAFISHLQVLVISEEVAREGITSILDFFYRDHEVRSDFFVLVAKDDQSAKEIMSIVTPLENVPSQNIFDSLQYGARSYGGTRIVTLDDLYQDATAPGIEPALMGVTVIGDLKEGQDRANAEKNAPAATLLIEGLAIFRNNALVGWLNQDQSKGLNYITGDIRDSVGSFTCPDSQEEEFALESFKERTKYDVRIVNNRPIIDLTVDIGTHISEVNCKDLDLSKEENFYLVEEQAEQEFVAKLQDTVQEAKAHQADVLGFGQMIHRKHPKVWEQLEDNWDEEFPNVEVTYEVNINITDTGNIINSFSEDD
ncbi:Ger(x)C family spore germination protein [Geomicrobium sp. JCM 19038]|uniref:Ger(x)C family spore germination protein n=1 Tax=Geomicrobium sp. JCM 19038 TaxID=1460635 RepID=UPI00045F4A4B|nr:Ger(x)C family spore germination protein [Geomicrobium sp. JCM 19038]GAK09077.1 spore germination protein GerKC [Geomicrobium sp. JCM 19038]